MAVELEDNLSAGLIADGNLSSNQYLAVIPSAAVAHAVKAQTTAGTAIAGVLKNNPQSGFAAVVQRSGLTKMVAGGTIADGGPVMSSATGSAIAAATTGSIQIGWAREAAVIGQIFSVELTPNYGTHA